MQWRSRRTELGWVGIVLVVVFCGQTMVGAQADPTELSPGAGLTGRIVYSTAEGIWVMGAGGANLRQVTQSDPAFSDYDPALSPDGQTLAFRGGRATPPDSTMLVDVDGTNERSLAVLVGLPEGSGMAQQGWSPDGTTLVFTCECPANTNTFGPHSGVYTANVDGSELTKLNDDGQYPDWSPDGTKIVYMADRDGNHELYVMNADGGDETNITHNPASDNVPRWSPDGTKIVFFSDRDGNEEIYTINPDGTGLTRVTRTEEEYEEFPVWTPDGRIVFSRGVPDSTGTPLTWHLVEADGADEVELTYLSEVGATFVDWVPGPPGASGGPAATPAPIPAITGGIPSSPAAVSSSGQLVFSSGRAGNADIYSVNADGTGENRLTSDPADDFDPTWSPDGAMVSFRSTRDGNDEIYVMNADGSNQRNLTNDPAGDWSPAWSPGGTTIAYATFAFGGVFAGGSYTDIALINIDGTGRTRLTEAHGEYPNWSPDGTRIAFTSGRAGSYDIWVMDADGENQVNLTGHPAYESSAAWSPDGTRIAFDAEWNEAADDGESGIGFDFELFVMDAGGGNQTSLTWDAASEDRFPAWGPNGQIAFNRNGLLYLVDGPGAEPVPLPGPIEGQFPAWRLKGDTGT